MEKSEIVNLFQKEGYPKKTIYDNINSVQFGGTINDKKKTGRPTSWTPPRKNQLKRLKNKVRVDSESYINECLKNPSFFHP